MKVSRVSQQQGPFLGCPQLDGEQRVKESSLLKSKELQGAGPTTPRRNVELKRKLGAAPKQGQAFNKFNFLNCHPLILVKQKQGGKLEGSCKEKIPEVSAEVDVISPFIKDVC